MKWELLLLGDILSRADVVVSCLPDTPATQGLYTEKRFLEMKEGLFLSTSAAAMPSTGLKKKALQSGHLAGAAIDVATPEPLPESDPLWEAPNLLVTPHVSGGTILIDVGCNHCHKLPQPCAFHQGGTPRKYCRQGDGLSQIDAIFWDFPAKLRTNP